MKILLLSGGSGQRLWPLSNDNCSKQYIKFIEHDDEVDDRYLVSDRSEKCSMLQRVYEQLSEAGFANDVIIAASEAQREIVASQLGEKVQFSAEPMRRDTFPAVLLASSFVKSFCCENKSEDSWKKETVVCVPVDPYVKVDYFKKLIELGNIVSASEKGVIGLMGAIPTYPSAKYGYICVGENNEPEDSTVPKSNGTSEAGNAPEDNGTSEAGNAPGDTGTPEAGNAPEDNGTSEAGNASKGNGIPENGNTERDRAAHGSIRVTGFVEKPDEDKATELIASGALWNCGVFCFTLETAAEWAVKYNLEFDYNTIFSENAYQSLPKISFDYEVLERTKKIIAVSYREMWKDIGTWNTLSEEMREPSSGNVVIDDVSERCNVINTLDTPVILMGGKDLIVAASSDGILVADKEQSSLLKNALARVDITPRYEERRWGTIKTIDRSEEDGIGICTNMVKVKEGQFTTLHRHMKHEEIITIISGEGVLYYHGVNVELYPGTSLTINRGVLHRITAIKKLKYIEVLFGDVSSDDIERIER